MPSSPDHHRRGPGARTSGRDDKSAQQRIRAIFILIFGVTLAGLGLFVAPWGLIADTAVTGLDVSRAVSDTAARSSQIPGVTSFYIGTLMLFLPFVLAALTAALAFVPSRVQVLRWSLAGVCVSCALWHALAVRDAFAGSAGYGSWMVGAGYLVLGYVAMVVARAVAVVEGVNPSG